MAGKILITGFKEVDAKLAQFGPKLANKIQRSALRKAGKLVQDQARANLDANDSVESGKLRSGVRVKAGKRSRTGASIIVQTSSGRHEDPGFGGAEVEFGTKHSQQKSFLRPAVYDNEEKLREFFIADVKEQINESSSGVK